MLNWGRLKKAFRSFLGADREIAGMRGKAPTCEHACSGGLRQAQAWQKRAEAGGRARSPGQPVAPHFTVSSALHSARCFGAPKTGTAGAS